MVRSRIPKGWQTVSEVSLVYNPKPKTSSRPKVKSSEELYQLLRKQWNKNTINLREEAKLVLLNRDGRVLGINNLGTGGIAQLHIDPKLVFATALKAAATVIALCHNHPSGSARPSESDIRATDTIKKIADLFDIKLLDHIIITADGYYSFAERGIL